MIIVINNINVFKYFRTQMSVKFEALSCFYFYFYIAHLLAVSQSDGRVPVIIK